MIGTVHGIGGLSEAALDCTRDCTAILEGRLQQGEPVDYEKSTLEGKRKATSVWILALALAFG